MRAWLESRVHHLWTSAWGPWLLWPLTALYALILKTRALAIRSGLLGKPIAVGKPVIVVGNLTVGGSGKTPLTVWLVEWFTKYGLRVGVLSRGYGGRSRGPVWVTAASDPREVGDEPVLIAKRTPALVCVARARVAGALRLAEHVDVIVCDDGLQHWRLARDLEWLVIDGRRRFGNGWLLPAGPLREPTRRVVDARVCNGGPAREDEWLMRLVPVEWVRLQDHQAVPLAALAGQSVKALAGMGDPERFFKTLEALELRVERHPLADHAPWALAGNAAALSEVWVMTEKDAVKCPQDQPVGAHWYYLKVSAELEGSALEAAQAMLWGLWRLGGSYGPSHR